MKSTRSAELEMLEGRQVERANNTKVGCNCGSRPKGPLGLSRFQPGTQTHRLEAYATLLSGVSSDLSKCFLTGVPRARSDGVM
jgi:hypothetical protein